MEEIERIVEALSGLEGVRTVTRGWPKQETALPCIAVQLASEQGSEYRDDSEYLTELEYYVRVFARTAAEVDGLIPRLRESMDELGYQRGFAWEDADERVHQRVERYKTVI